jgi:hypothetical protein
LFNRSYSPAVVRETLMLARGSTPELIAGQALAGLATVVTDTENWWTDDQG